MSTFKDKLNYKTHQKQLNSQGISYFQKVNYNFQNQNISAIDYSQKLYQFNDYLQTHSTRCPSQPNSMQTDQHVLQNKSDFDQQKRHIKVQKLVSFKTKMDKLEVLDSNFSQNQTLLSKQNNQNSLGQEIYYENSSNSQNQQTKTQQFDDLNVQQCSSSQLQKKLFTKVKFKQIISKFGIKKSVSMAARKKIQLIRVDPCYAIKYTPEKPLKITVSQLAEIYTLSPRMQQSIILHQCCKSDAQKVVFQGFIENLKKINTENIKTKLTLAKIRTIIVRRVLNQLVDTLVQPGQNQQFHVRMNMQYRNRYKKAGIPIPPARMQNSYLEKIFGLQVFIKYYQKFIDQRLLEYLQQENKDKTRLYQIQILYLVKSITKKVNSQKICQILQKCKKPFAKSQIQLIKREAQKMLDQYGKGKKRIGNKKNKKETIQISNIEANKIQKFVLIQKQKLQISDQNQNPQSNAIVLKKLIDIKQKSRQKLTYKAEQNSELFLQEIQLISSFQEKRESFRFNEDDNNNSFQKLMFG